MRTYAKEWAYWMMWAEHLSPPSFCNQDGLLEYKMVTFRLRIRSETMQEQRKSTPRAAESMSRPDQEPRALCHPHGNNEDIRDALKDNTEWHKE